MTVEGAAYLNPWEGLPPIIQQPLLWFIRICVDSPSETEEWLWRGTLKVGWTSLKKCDSTEDKRIQECNDKTLEVNFIAFLSLQGLELSTAAIK